LQSLADRVRIAVSAWWVEDLQINPLVVISEQVSLLRGSLTSRKGAGLKTKLLGRKESTSAHVQRRGVLLK
jgi:hypothetical protein